MKAAFKMLADFDVASYLNCPYCPATAYPAGITSYSGRISRLEVHLVKYCCISKHTFFVEAKEKDE
jgi:hypothetical protein